MRWRDGRRGGGIEDRRPPTELNILGVRIPIDGEALAADRQVTQRNRTESFNALLSDEPDLVRTLIDGVVRRADSIHDILTTDDRPPDARVITQGETIVIR